MATDREKFQSEAIHYVKTDISGPDYVKFRSNPAMMHDLTLRVLNQRSWLFGVDGSITDFDDCVRIVAAAISKL